MENNDIKTLIDSFRGYRELLSPIQANLRDFAETYDSMKEDISRLNNAFEGDMRGNLQKIYKNLSEQAEHATDLSSRIKQFIEMSEKYSEGVTRIADQVEKIGERLKAVNELDGKAEEQIGKLDEILAEKRKNYNLKELERTLDNYNANVLKVSEFINKDIAEALNLNYNKLESIKASNDTMTKRIKEEHIDVEKLLETYSATNELLKRTVEKEDVNEAYIFEILDKWAEERKIKIKK